MRFAICDDDADMRHTIKLYIKEYFKENHLGKSDITEFSSGEELLDDESYYDIIFIDVEMNGISGINASRRLSKRSRHTLFIIITAYNDYLDEAMRIQAFRFISKPVNKERFMRNLKDALHVINTNNEKIAIVTKKDVTTMFTSDIVMIEVCQRKVIVYTTDGIYESREPLSYYIERLNPNVFYQPNRGYVVNMGFIDSFDNDKVSLYGGKYTAYVTRRKYTDMKNAYLVYLNSVT
ncbi:MAG: LytR/AlgR family response regulator transcription factor [Lachnospira sp.]